MMPLIALLMWGAMTHVFLYGFRRAPVNIVVFTRRQWLAVAIVGGLPAFGLAAVLVYALAFGHAREPWISSAVGWCFGLMLATVVGMMPASKGL